MRWKWIWAARPPRARIGLGIMAVVVGLLGVAGCGSGSATPFGVSKAWARPTAASQTTAAVYLRIDGGPDGDTLTGASIGADVAASAELHQTVSSASTTTMAPMGGMDPSDMNSGDDMSTMKAVTKVDIGAGKTVRFEPGGYHVMLVGLVHPLRAGQHLTLTLRFTTHGAKTVEVTVGDAAPA